METHEKNTWCIAFYDADFITVFLLVAPEVPEFTHTQAILQ